MGRGIRCGAKKDYVVRNYKGFNYSYMWHNNKNTQSIGSMVYSVDAPQAMKHCDDLRKDTKTYLLMFRYFDTAKEMKQSINEFIERYPNQYKKFFEVA